MGEGVFGDMRQNTGEKIKKKYAGYLNLKGHLSLILPVIWRDCEPPGSTQL
jgi:hypothetical protein